MRVIAARNTQYAVRNRRGGFTLLELIVAAAILAFGTVAVLEAITHGLANSRMSYEHTRAVQLAELKMAELRASGTLDNGTAEGSFSDVPLGQGLSENFRWRTEVQSSQEEGMALARVTILWGGGRRVRQVTFESLLPNTPQTGKAHSGR